MVLHCEKYHKDVLQFGNDGFDAKLLQPDYFEKHILQDFFPASDSLAKWERRVKKYDFVIEKMTGGGVYYRHATRLFYRDDVDCGEKIQQKRKETFSSTKTLSPTVLRACKRTRTTRKSSEEGFNVKKQRYGRLQGGSQEDCHNERVTVDLDGGMAYSSKAVPSPPFPGDTGRSHPTVLPSAATSGGAGAGAVSHSPLHPSRLSGIQSKLLESIMKRL